MRCLFFRGRGTGEGKGLADPSAEGYDTSLPIPAGNDVSYRVIPINPFLLFPA